MANQVTFEHVLKINKGLGPGFDFLRISLAGGIVIFHCYQLTGNDWIHSERPYWFLEYALVPMFFALSGFLVSSSAQRLSLGNFLINRGLRIIPALAVDIFFCALVIGPLVTTVSLDTYFSDVQFFSYFLNITGWIHYLLPGVFKTHPSVNVNGALWTVPFEIGCYVMMSFFIITRWIAKPLNVALTAVVITALGIALGHGVLRIFGINDAALALTFDNRHVEVLTAFLLGVLCYQIRSKIFYTYKIFYISIILCILDVFIFKQGVITGFFMLPLLVYITIFIGLTPVPIPRFLHRGDYSYGIYLYHNPFLQVIIGFSPATFCAHRLGPVLLAILGLPVVFCVAFGSWHFVEKPILGLRKKYSFVARVRGVASEQDASVAPPTEARPAPDLPARGVK